MRMGSRAMSASAAILRPSLEKITARIAVSEYARSTLVQHIGGEPVVIPNGVHLDKFAPPAADERRLARKALGIPVDARVAAFVGHEFDRKGVVHRSH